MVNRTVALIIRKTCQLWWFNWLNYGTEILLLAAPRDYIPSISVENIAGSGQRSQRKRFVVRRRSGKGTWSWITEFRLLKWGIHSRSNIVWFPDGGRWPSSQKLGHSRRCWLCKLKWFLLRTGFSPTVMLFTPSLFSNHRQSLVSLFWVPLYHLQMDTCYHFSAKTF